MATQAHRPTAADLKPPITVQQWGELEGPPHYELVDGHLREKPDVALWHDIFLMDFLRYLLVHVHSHDLGKIVGMTAKLKISSFKGRQPDIFWIPKQMFHLVGRNLFHGVPPLAIEALSPTNEETDRVEKVQEYAELGIGQYWIIDCPNRRIEIYQLAEADEGKRLYQLAEVVEGNAVFRPALFPGLEIPLAEIWPAEFENRTDE